MAFDSVESVEVAVDRLLAAITGPLVVATPLGLGKPNRLINALYRRVKDDPARPLTLYTALSLERPRVAGGLEGRFAGPFIERHFGADYPDLEYLADIRAGTLPMHVDVREFYMQSGAMLRVERAQRSYTSLNYTHVSRELASRGVNLMLQMVARRGDRLSFSSNSDTTLDLLDHLRRQGKPRPYVVCVVHPDLPFLDHDEPLPLEFADLLVEKPGPAYRLFALPRASVAPAEFALGLHASALVRDGGTLQIGIGALSDALVHGLILRQRENASWRQSLEALRNGNGTPAIVRDWGGEGPLADGLYGASEMVMDGFMHLREAGILRRRVWDYLPLEQALADRAVSETLAPGALEALLEYGAIPHRLDPEAVERLIGVERDPARQRARGRCPAPRRRPPHRQRPHGGGALRAARRAHGGPAPARRALAARRLLPRHAAVLPVAASAVGRRLGGPVHGADLAHQRALRRRRGTASPAAPRRALLQHLHDADPARRRGVRCARGRAGRERRRRPVQLRGDGACHARTAARC